MVCRHFRTTLAVAFSIGFAMLLVLQPSRLVAQDPKSPAQDQPVSFWMRKKLEFSQNILGGIATADYDKVVQNAEAMGRLSRVEGFIRRQTPGYQTQLKIFEESVAEIARQAKRENADGAGLAFTQMTVSCVNCHKRIREVEK
jgi:hypothetical protein